MRNITLLALVSALSFGCAAARLGPLDPRPKVKVEKQEARLALSIGEEVPDRFSPPIQGGVRKVRVKGWHETLTRAFENGLGRVYAVQPPGAEHDLELVIVFTDLQLVPTPGVATEGQTPARAKLTYRARVVDAAGKALALSGGEQNSAGTWSVAGELEVITAEVVAAMYEDIAFDLVTKTPPAPPAEPAAPQSP